MTSWATPGLSEAGLASAHGGQMEGDEPGAIRTLATEGLPLLLVMMGGLALRLWYLSVVNLNWDEGIFIYDARRLLEGGLPFRDVLVKDPLHGYLVALAVRIGGYQMDAVRYMAILFGTAGIGAVYLAARTLLQPRVALLAAAMVALSPASLVYETQADPRPPMLFFLGLVMALVGFGVRKHTVRPILVAAAVLGVLIWFHRIFAFPALLLPLAMFFVLRQRSPEEDSLSGVSSLSAWLRRFALPFLSVWLVTVAAFLPLLIVFSTLSSFQWVNVAWGFGGGRESASDFLGVGSLLTPLGARLFHDAWREWLHLFLPAWVFVISAIGSMRRLSLAARQILVAILSGVGLGFLILGTLTPPIESYGGYVVPTWREVAFLFLLGGGVFTALLASRRGLLGPSPGLRSNPAFLPMFWAGCLALFLVLVSPWLLHYLQYLAYPGAVMASVVLLGWMRALRDSQTHPRTRLLSALLVGIVVASGAVSASDLSVSRTWRPLTQGQVNAVSSFLTEFAEPGDVLLTGFPSIAVQSGLPLLFNLTRLQFYGEPSVDDPTPFDPFNLVPSLSEIRLALETGLVTYVVADPLLVDVFFRIHPEVGDLVQAHFDPVAVVSGLVIHEYHGITSP